MKAFDLTRKILFLGRGRADHLDRTRRLSRKLDALVHKIMALRSWYREYPDGMSYLLTRPA